MSITTIDYNDLISTSDEKSEEILNKISRGFGNLDDSLGIIAVTSIPNYNDLREKLLRLSHRFATCTPKVVLEELTISSAQYQVGWSHGKERVEGKNKFDTAKGSYYANPLSDNVLEQTLKRDFDGGGDDQKMREEFIRFAEENPAFYAQNVWPKSTLPDFERSFKEMGTLIRDIGLLVAKRCDSYVSAHCKEYEPGKMENIITKSMCCKGRLLHYFPVNTDDITDSNDSSVDGTFSWCGWHNDHCSLTGLVPAMYIDEDGNEIDCPDSRAGLYCKSRKGDLIQVKIPSDCLAFQIGETTQIHTGGLLQATPHAVRGCNKPGVSRESFAVFMQPEYLDDMTIPCGKDIEDAQGRESDIHLPPSVRTLKSRWKPGMNFGEFSDATFAAFY